MEVSFFHFSKGHSFRQPSDMPFPGYAESVFHSFQDRQTDFQKAPADFSSSGPGMHFHQQTLSGFFRFLPVFPDTAYKPDSSYQCLHRLLKPGLQLLPYLLPLPVLPAGLWSPNLKLQFPQILPYPAEAL